MWLKIPAKIFSRIKNKHFKNDVDFLFIISPERFGKRYYIFGIPRFTSLNTLGYPQARNHRRRSAGDLGYRQGAFGGIKKYYHVRHLNVVAEAF